MCGLLGNEGAVRKGCKDLEAGECEFGRESGKRIAKIQKMQRSKGLETGEQLSEESGNARCKGLVLEWRERDMDGGEGRGRQGRSCQ